MYQNYLFYLYYLSSQAISSIVSSSSISLCNRPQAPFRRNPFFGPGMAHFCHHVLKRSTSPSMTTAPNMTTGALAGMQYTYIIVIDQSYTSCGLTGSSNKRVAEASQPHSTIKKAKRAPSDRCWHVCADSMRKSRTYILEEGKCAVCL